MTNFVETRQTHGLCDEDYSKNNCTCVTDEDCISKIATTTNTWNGKRNPLISLNAFFYFFQIA